EHCAEEYVERDMRRRRLSARGSDSPATVTRGSRHRSSTNLLVTDVDEADAVKHDGKHLYVLSGGKLHIFTVHPKGNVKPGVSRLPGYRTDDYLKLLSTTLVGPNASEFFLHDTRVVLLGSVGAEGDSECRESHACVHLGD